MKTKPARDRLKEKNSRGLLINRLQKHFNFSPAMAKVLSDDAIYLRTIYAPNNRQDGQIIWYGVKRTEPAGKALKDCEYVAATLTLHHPDDIPFRHKHGLLELKRRIMKRISDEAVVQGAPLTHEDIGVILLMDRGTVADHIAELKKRGQIIITRSHYTDAGRGVTHKRPIIKLFLLGMSETEIAHRTGHTLDNVERYIDGLLRVALSYLHGDTPQLISRMTGFSLFLVKEYLDLYQELADDETFADPIRKVLDFYTDGLLPRQVKKGGLK